MDITRIPQEFRLEKETRHVYGTAGFRDKASKLPIVVYRMGVLAVLRSRAKGAAVGVMITASHNPEQDNGVKLIDPHGEMLEQSWEKYATEIANVRDDDLPDLIRRIIDQERIDPSSGKGSIFCAYDTRPSSWDLHNAAKIGVAVMDGLFSSFGQLTTPQLHYIVRCANTLEKYGIASESGYYKKISEAFLELATNNTTREKPTVFVDGANGIGAIQLKKMANLVESALKIDVINCGEGKLNHECGADHVKITQKPPTVYTSMRAIEPGQRWASLDGDGDRLVYFYIDKYNTFHLLDGDKMAALIALFIGELLEAAGLPRDKSTVGIVQTAYANGSSTKFIEDVLDVPVFCVPTGVKHLHKKATQLDIGVYFEPNGHGTIVFSNRMKDDLAARISKEEDASSSRLVALKRLQRFIDLVNETIGDALSDLLIVETILASKNWAIDCWDALYKDVPYRQLKVAVKDRSVVTTTDAERRCVTPAGLQDKIDSLVSKYASARAFVRPSGTEDVVRVYAEADTAEMADDLASKVADAVNQLAG